MSVIREWKGRTGPSISSGNAEGSGSLWRDLGAGLSLANLCYFRIWSEILTYTKENAFWMKSPPGKVEFVAVTLNVLLLGILLGLGLRWIHTRCWRKRPGAVEWMFLAVLLVPLNGIRAVASQHLSLLGGELFRATGGAGVALIGLALAAVGAAAFYLWHVRIVRGARAVGLILLPFVPLTFAQGAWKLWSYDAAPFLDKPLAARLPAGNAARPRVVWVVFDELDYLLAFEQRPAGVQLPEFDRLARESLHATHAIGANGSTLLSVTGLITGAVPAQVREIDHDEALVRYDTGPPVLLGSRPTIFSKARAAGYNTGLVGWYFPYGRVYNGSLTECLWTDMVKQFNSMGSGFGEIMLNQTRSLVETSLLSPFGQSLSTRHRVRNYHQLMEQSEKLAADPGMGLTFLHLPVPHSPHPYDRFSHQFTLANSPVRGYLHSLALADAALGRLRRAIERAGLWDRTTLLVSSDHHFRARPALNPQLRRDYRVPFLLKLAGQKQEVVAGEEFNTRISYELVLGVLEGRIRTGDDALALFRE